MASTGTQDVLAVAALLQSTAPDEQQLKDAANILSLKIPSTKALLDWNLQLDSIQWRPLEDRILRWLLSKLDKQEASPGNSIIDPSAYTLLFILITSCPETVLRRHLQHVDLSEVLCKCLVYTRRALEQLRYVRPGKDEKKSLKRKRSPGERESSDDMREQCLAILASICRLLNGLHHKSSSGTKARIYASTAGTILRASVRQAGLIMEAALWCILSTIGHGALHNELSVNNQLIRPCLSIWELARTTHKAGDDLHSARVFARYCLLPCLALQVQEPELFLDSVIKQYCLLPLMRSDNADEDTETMISTILIQLEQYQEASEWQSTEVYESAKQQIDRGLPLLVQLVGQLCASELTTKKKFAAHWFEELFTHLTGYVDVDHGTETQMALSIQQSSFLMNLLTAYQAVGQDPGEAILSRLVLSCHASASTPFSVQPWRIIQRCLAIKPSIVHATLQGEAITTHILSQIGLVDTEMKLASLKIQKEKVESAVSYLLEPLLDALTIERSLITFVPEWQACIEKALSISLDIEDGEAIKKQSQVFWEHDCVQTAIQRRISKSINSTELHNLIMKMLKELPSISKKRKDVCKFYSQMIMWPTIIKAYWGTHSGNASSKQDRAADRAWVMQLHDITTEYHQKHNLQHEPIHLVLELLLELHSTVAKEPADMAWSHILEIFSSALWIIDTAITDTLSPGAYDCASTMWSLLSLWLYEPQYELIEDNARSVFMKLWHLINEQLRDTWQIELAGSKSSRPSLQPINTGRFNLQNSSDFIYTCIQDAITYPQLLDVLEPDDLENLATNLFVCALLSTSADDGEVRTGSSVGHSPPSHSWRTLWSALASSDVAAESTTLYQTISKLRVTIFIDAGKALIGSSASGIQMQIQTHEFMLTEFDHVKIKSIHREERGKMMDKIMKHLEFEGFITSLISPSLRLLSRLMKWPTKSTELLANSKVLWVLGSCLREHTEMQNIENLRSIIKAVTKYWIQDGNASKAIIEDFFKDLASRVARAREQTMKISDAIIIATAFSIFDSSDNHKSMIGEATYRQFLECQLRDLLTMNDDKPKPSMEILALLHNITSLPAPILKSFDWLQRISNIDSKTRSETTTIYRYLQDARDGCFQVIPSKDNMTEDDIAVHCWTCSQRLLALINDEDQQIAEFTGQDLSYLSIEAGARRLHELQVDFRHLAPDRKARILDTMTGSGKTKSEISQLNYLRGLVSYAFPLTERTATLKTALEKVFEHTMRQMEEPSQFRYILLHSKVTQAILLQNPWIIKQEHIDRTLIMITILTSQSCKVVGLPSNKGGLLHSVLDSFVSLLKVIFQNHRPKIGGRWHLIIDALRGILRCHFIPYPDLNSKETIPQPSWIVNQDLYVEKEDHIGSLSRLLSGICDPTHKTLKSNKKQSHNRTLLNDATKAARAISGQHMQHLVGEFCSLQLKGKMVHQDAIKPGLYAIFDAMSQDVKKSLNESLDPQTRIMFKNLYDEWMRFGKWTGS